MSTKKRLVSLFAIFFFMNNVMTAIASVQRIPFLSGLGYTPSQRSMMFSILALASIVGQLVFGFVSDKYRTVKKIVVVVILGFTASSYFLYSMQEQLFLYHFVFLTLSGGLQNIQVDLIDSWAMQSGNEVREKFSLIKGFQSFGYVTGTILTSFIIAAFGYAGIARSLLLVGIILLGIGLLISDTDRTATTEKLRFGEIGVLLKNKPYMLALLLFMCYFSITQVHAISIADKILYLGGNESHIAMRAVVAVGLEAVAYMFCDRLYRKYGAFVLLRVSAVFFIIMYVLFILSTHPVMIVIVGGLQMFTVAPYIVSMKHIVFDLSPDHLKSTGQLLVTALLVGISGTLTPLLVGMLTERFSVNVALSSSIVFGILALILIPLVKKEIEHASK